MRLCDEKSSVGHKIGEFKATLALENVQIVAVKGDRLGSKDIFGHYFLFLRCPFSLLRIFKDSVHRKKKYLRLGLAGFGCYDFFPTPTM